MPRNRMLKPEFWNDEKLGSDTEGVQLTYAGTWTFSDDYGVVKGNPIWLKNQIFPYKQALRLEVFTKWLEALEGHDALIPFTLRGEKYYFIRTFRLHQNVEKPSKTRNCTEQELRDILLSMGYQESSDRSWVKVGEQSGNTPQLFGDEEKRSIIVREVKRAKALVVAAATPATESNALKKEWESLVENLTGKDLKTVWSGLRDFISQKKPDFIDPYKEAWNIFAAQYKLSAVEVLNESRKKKFKTRIQEQGFDFLKILEKIKNSALLKGLEGSWKVSFDWIIENDNNYAKILNGNYD